MSDNQLKIAIEWFDSLEDSTVQAMVTTLMQSVFNRGVGRPVVPLPTEKALKLLQQDPVSISQINQLIATSAGLIGWNTTLSPALKLGEVVIGCGKSVPVSTNNIKDGR